MIGALKRRALLLFIATGAVAVAVPAAAQQAKNWSWLQGCQVTFVLRTAALTIDAAWLEASMLPDVLRHACPSQPVEATSVWFSSAVLDVLKIKDLGHRDHHPDWLLDVHPSPADKGKPGTQSAPADRVRGQPVDASIEMHTTPIVKRAREYDIHYSSPDPTLAGEAKIDCGDDPVNRTCSRRGYPPFAGLMVDYRISQDQFPAPSEVSTDPNTESGAILQFDQRLREWLIDLERPR